MSTLSTHEEWPENVATAPEPGLPDGESLTSCTTSLLSSDAEMSTCRDSDYARVKVSVNNIRWSPATKRAIERP